MWQYKTEHSKTQCIVFLKANDLHHLPGRDASKKQRAAVPGQVNVMHFVNYSVANNRNDSIFLNLDPAILKLMSKLISLSSTT